MLSFLEKLDEPFFKKFKKEVGLNEITAFSLQLSPKTAIVMTNSSLYTFKKRLIGMDFKKILLKEISHAYYEDSVIIDTTTGESVVLAVQKNKRDLAAKAVDRINLKLSQPPC